MGGKCKIKHNFAYGIRFDYCEVKDCEKKKKKIKHGCLVNRRRLSVDEDDGESTELQRRILDSDSPQSPGGTNLLSSPQSTDDLWSPTSNTDNESVFMDDGDLWRRYQYPFENLALSGGGSRGYAYIGLIKALEDADLIRHIRRYIGSSAGGVMVAMVAVGCTAQDISTFFSGDLKEFYIGAKSCWRLPFARLFTRFAFYSMSIFHERYSEMLQEKTGNKDITFKQLYDQYGKELCVPVTNLTKMCSEYCHHTTTPDLPIRVAIKITIAAPGLIEAEKTDLLGTGMNLYVDGGTLENYPVSYYDDVDAITNVKSCNEKTLGAFLMSEDQYSHKMWHQTFGTSMDAFPSYLPDTKIARTKLKQEMKLRRKTDKLFNAKEYVQELQDDPYICGEQPYMRHYDISNRETCDITGPLHYMSAVLTTLLLSQKHTLVQSSDILRTIGINCGYIGAGDTLFEPEDREFLIRQGYEQAQGYLLDYVARQPPPPSQSQASLMDHLTPLVRRYSMSLNMKSEISRVWNGRRRSSYRPRPSVYCTPMLAAPRITLTMPSVGTLDRLPSGQFLHVTSPSVGLDAGDGTAEQQNVQTPGTEIRVPVSVEHTQGQGQGQSPEEKIINVSPTKIEDSTQATSESPILGNFAPASSMHHPLIVVEDITSRHGTDTAPVTVASRSVGSSLDMLPTVRVIAPTPTVTAPTPALYAEIGLVGASAKLGASNKSVQSSVSTPLMSEVVTGGRDSIDYSPVMALTGTTPSCSKLVPQVVSTSTVLTPLVSASIQTVLKSIPQRPLPVKPPRSRPSISQMESWTVAAPSPPAINIPAGKKLFIQFQADQMHSPHREVFMRGVSESVY